MRKRINTALSFTATGVIIGFGTAIVLTVAIGYFYTARILEGQPDGCCIAGPWMGDTPVNFLTMIATFAGVLTSFAAALILWRTLAAVAETNQIMRDEQRPWLSFSPEVVGTIERRNHPRTRVPELRIRLDVHIKNMGRLPAESVKCFYALTISDSESRPNFSSIEFNATDYSNVIAPGSTSTLFISCRLPLTKVHTVAPSDSDRFLPSIKLETNYKSGLLQNLTAVTEFQLYRRGNDGSFPRMALEDLPLPPPKIYIRQKDGPAT